MKISVQVIIATIAFLPVAGIAQMKPDKLTESVRISGRVSDATGAPVRDVAVVLKLVGSDYTSGSTKTSETGEYTFQVVPHRSYELHFDSPGFRRETKVVMADKDTDVGTLALSVGVSGGPSSVVMDSPVEIPGSATQSQQKGQGQKIKPAAKLWAAISVPQPIYEEGSETDRLQVYFGVYNDGHSAINPNVESSHLLINGVEPEDWSFVIANGIRTELFRSLPPGQTLQFTYLLGERYFRKPGIYTVRWGSETFKSSALTFRVVPRSRLGLESVK